MNNIITLIIEFFKTGLFAIGGGLATIPFLREMISTHGWFSETLLSTMIAVSESTPGPIGINMATYTGYMVEGVFGGIITTLALITPSIIVIIIISNMLNKFKSSQIVKDIFYGIRPAVVGFILSACMSIFIMTFFSVSKIDQTKSIFNFVNIAIFAVVFYIYKKWKMHPIAIISLCAIVGILFNLV